MTLNEPGGVLRGLQVSGFLKNLIGFGQGVQHEAVPGGDYFIVLERMHALFAGGEQFFMDRFDGRLGFYFPGNIFLQL